MCLLFYKHLEPFCAKSWIECKSHNIVPTTHKITLNAAKHSYHLDGNKDGLQPCYAHLCATKWRQDAPDGI